MREEPSRPSRYRQLFEHSVAGIFRAASDGTLLEANRSMAELTGRAEPGELIGLRLRQLAERVEPLRHGQRLLDALGEAVAIEVPIARPDGRRAWALVSAALAPPEAGLPGEIFGTAVDITARKLAEERLRESEERFALLFDASPAPTAVSTLDRGVLVAANPAFARLLGYEASAILGRSVIDLGLWSDPADRIGLIDELMRLGAITPREVRLKRGDGKPMTVVFSGQSVSFGGEPCLLAFSFDVEERVRAERELRERKALLEQAEEVATMGSWISDVGLDGRLVWSKEVYRILGVDPAAFDGRVATFFELVHPDDREAVAAASRAALAGEEEYRIDHRVSRPSGEVRWVHERARVLRDADGRPLQMLGIVQDITERKRLEEQYLQSQKLEVVGRLAGGVAHDFNNLLTVILGYGESVLEQTPRGTPVRDAAEQICRAAEHAAKLTRSLLALSRKSIAEPGIVDLGELVGDFERLLARLLGEDIAIELEVAAAPCRVAGDAAQLEQVLLNLAINARDAMPDGGRLWIAVEPTTVARSDADRFGRAPGRYVRVTIADDGAGIAPEHQPHIFEPFFTTKEKGRGTGLGLATVLSVVEAHGGSIRVESSPGQGSRFEILLPAAEAARTRPAEPARDPAPAVGKGTILLVEDEAALRHLAASVLGRAGFEVLEAATGDEAVAIGLAALDRIDLLLSDVVLPGPRGPDVYRRLRAHRPDLPVLFMTGYAEWHPQAGESPELPGPVLPKPFTGSELVARVAERLGEGASRPPKA